MKKSFLIILMTIVLILSSCLNAFADDGSASISDLYTADTSSLELEAQGAILIDATTGQILYSLNENEHFYPASITKLMTVLLALEYGNLDETVTFSYDAVFGIERDSSHIAIDVGEELTLEQCLYAIMLASANEAALGVAEHIDGSKEAFAQHMNQRAKELGCLNTNFVNPNGLHDDNHYTSAYDMSLIAKELLKFPKFIEMMSTLYYRIEPTNIQPEPRDLYAQHKMIKESSQFYYEGCMGGKTGYTDQAKSTLVTYAKRGNTTLIAVVLCDTAQGIYRDTAKLFDFGFENYETKTLLDKSTYATNTVDVFTSSEDTEIFDTISAQAAQDVTVTLPKDLNISDIKTNLSLEDKLIAPIEKDSVVGQISFSYNNILLGTSDLVSNKEVIPPTAEEISQETKENILSTVKTVLKFIGIGLLILILLFFVLVIIIRCYYKIRRTLRRRRKRNRYKKYRQYSKYKNSENILSEE